MNIGKLIGALSFQPRGNLVEYDFCGAVPTSVDSYRGFYDQPALGYDFESDMTVEALQKELTEAASGKMFTGYKGGEYSYSLEHELWVSNYGDCCNTIISGIYESDYDKLIICTAYRD